MYKTSTKPFIISYVMIGLILVFTLISALFAFHLVNNLKDKLGAASYKIAYVDVQSKYKNTYGDYVSGAKDSYFSFITSTNEDAIKNREKLNLYMRVNDRIDDLSKSICLIEVIALILFVILIFIEIYNKGNFILYSVQSVLLLVLYGTMFSYNLIGWIICEGLLVLSLIGTFYYHRKAIENNQFYF